MIRLTFIHEKGSEKVNQTIYTDEREGKKRGKEIKQRFLQISDGGTH